MPKRLAGKVCIITGTGGSIGTAAAVAFAREGALVVGTGQRAGSSDEAIIEAVRDTGGAMVAFPIDLGSLDVGAPLASLPFGSLAGVSLIKT